jgi:hypothetical protein
MEWTLDFNEELRKYVSNYHRGSPVMIKGRKLFVTEEPQNGNELKYFKVFGESFTYQSEDFEPVALDEDFFNRHKDLFQEAAGLREFRGNHHILSVSKDYVCTIDGKEYGYVLTHELITLLESYCGIHIPYFDGFTSDEID